MTLPTPPHVLRDYAFIGDGERGGLIGPRGDVAWLCAPCWDSPAVFAGLLDGGGGYRIEPTERYVWGGHYEHGSLIWRSRWVTQEGVVESRDALAYPTDPHRVVLLRRVIATDADACVSVVLSPRADFGRRPFTSVRRERGVWTGRTGGLNVRWTGGADAHVSGGRSDATLHFELQVEAGHHHDFVLEISDTTLPDDTVDPDTAWRMTDATWDDVPDVVRAASRDARRSYAVLRGMTSRTHGMVAAATASLPERAEAGRNYDYRYVWIRDQCYAGQAAAALDAHPLLDDAVRFVTERILEHGPSLAPAYTVQGAAVPRQHTLDLGGYPGAEVRVGNDVRTQFQLDAFGECLLLLAAAARRDRLDDDSVRAGVLAAEAIAKRWSDHDAGIWEIEDRAWTHSRLICAAGLRGLATAQPSSRHGASWIALADHIVADTSRTSLHPSGRWQRAADDPRLDGALLLASIRGAIPADDPRTIATLRAYERDLTLDGYAFRFRHDDRPLGDAEGAFLLCGFFVALAKHQQRDDVDAVAWYERTQAACGSPGLYAEEFDPTEHQLRGNLPQAFVHALQLETSARLRGGPDWISAPNPVRSTSDDEE